MTAVAEGNGRVDAAELPDPATPDLVGLGRRTNALIDEVAAELRSMIMAEQTGRAGFEEAIAASRTRERKLTRTLKALEGSEPAKPGPKLGSKHRPRTGGSGRGHGWVVSDEKAAEVQTIVLAFALANPKGFTAGRVAGATPGVSPEAALQTITRMREAELVRPAGRFKGGTLWKLTPDGKTQAQALATVEASGNGA